MPDSKLIPTFTTISTVATSITITTRYVNDLAGGVLFAFISEVIGGESIDGESFIEGEGGIAIKDGFFPTSLNFFLNSDGELIVSAPDAANYGVNTDTGQLTYIF